MWKKISFLVVLAIALVAISSVQVRAANLDKAVVTFSGDDGYREFYTNVAPIMNQYSFTMTLNIVPWWIENQNPDGTRDGDGTSLSWTELWTLYWNYKFEVANHSENHEHLLTLSPDQVLLQINAAQLEFKTRGFVDVTAFAAPYGEYSDSIINLLKQVGYISSNRKAYEDGNQFNELADFNEWEIKVVPLEYPMTYAQVKTIIDQAVKGKKWLVFVVHQVFPGAIGQDQLGTTVFKQIVAYVSTLKKQGKLDVVTMTDGVSKMKHYQALP